MRVSTLVCPCFWCLGDTDISPLSYILLHWVASWIISDTTSYFSFIQAGTAVASDPSNPLLACLRCNHKQPWAFIVLGFALFTTTCISSLWYVEIIVTRFLSPYARTATSPECWPQCFPLFNFAFFTSGGIFFLLSHEVPTQCFFWTSRTEPTPVNYRSCPSTLYVHDQEDFLSAILQLLQFYLSPQLRTDLASSMPFPV
jgi:hypothetical protein